MELSIFLNLPYGFESIGFGEGISCSGGKIVFFKFAFFLCQKNIKKLLRQQDVN
jgi:hypothetical protein